MVEKRFGKTKGKYEYMVYYDNKVIFWVRGNSIESARRNAAKYLQISRSYNHTPTI